MASPYTIFIDNFRRGKGCWGKQQFVAAEVRSKIHTTVGNAETWTRYGVGPSKVNQTGQLNPSASTFIVNRWKPRYFSIMFCKSIERTVQFSKLLCGLSAHVTSQVSRNSLLLGFLVLFFCVRLVWNVVSASLGFSRPPSSLGYPCCIFQSGMLCPPSWAYLFLELVSHPVFVVVWVVSAFLGLSPSLSPDLCLLGSSPILSSIWSGMLCTPPWACLPLPKRKKICRFHVRFLSLFGSTVV